MANNKQNSFDFGFNVEKKEPSLFDTPKVEEVVDESIPVIVPNDNIEQPALIEAGEWWQEHWKEMPEYKSQDLMPFKTIYVHFENRKDMEDFARLVKQTITLETQSIWYPELEVQKLINKKYVEKKNQDANSTSTS